MKGYVALLAVLGALVTIELSWWLAGHRDESELRHAFETGSPRESLYALHVLANRGDPMRFGAEQVRAMLASDDGRVREYAMTWDLVRAAGEALQQERLWQLDDRLEAERWRFFLQYRVRSVSLESFRVFQRSLARPAADPPAAPEDPR